MRTRAAVGGFMLAATAGWNVSNVGAVADGLAHAYGVALWEIGLFTTALFVSHAGMQVPAGRLCDRFGARRVGILGLAVVCVASAVAATWKVAAFAIALRLVAGIGTGLSFVAGADYVRATVGSAVAQGWYGAGSMATGGLALAVVPQWGDWRAPFVSAALLAAVGAAAMVAAPAAEARPASADARARPTFADRRLLRLAAWHSASFGLSVVIGNWVVTLLHRAGGFSHGAAGVAGALTLLLGIVTRPLGGRAIGHARILRASFLAGGVGTLVLAAAMPYALAVAAAAVVGLAAGIPFAPSFAGAQRARPDAPGAAVGLVNMTAALTILVATPLVGLTFSLPGDGRIGFVVLAALWAVTAATVGRDA